MRLEGYVMLMHKLLRPVRKLRLYEKDRNYILRGSNYLLRVSDLE